MTHDVVAVAVGIIWNKAGNVLLAKRHDDADCGGLWEFPGGKIEDGETALEALQRELFEEIGITVNSADYIFTLPHQYPKKSVCLHVHNVYDFQHEPFGKEGQEVRWVEVAAFSDYCFPPANEAIVATVIQYHALRYKMQDAK